MVTNYTATEIGDLIFTNLQEPYEGVVRVTDWNVLVGMNTPNTIGGLTINAGNNTMVGVGTNMDFEPNEVFYVGSEAFTVETIDIQSQIITTVETPNFSTQAPAKFYKQPNNNNYFDKQFRWSQAPLDSDGGEMSELRPLNRALGPRDILGITFDDTKPLWISLKLEVSALSTLYSLSLLSITFELETETGTIQSCPQLCQDCEDPYLIGCTNIVTDCVDPVYNPYNLSKPTAIYKQISELSTKMWGHDVKYFRVEPDQRSRDVVLMEYSLYNVQEQGQIKIMIPDNEMPTQEFQYDIFGMGWEDFEIHITKGQMEQAFGIGKPPRARDYLYFPLMNRMYEVSSVAFADEFNMEMSYWRVMLRKYEERTSTIVDDSQIQTEMDNLTVGIEEVFGEELKEEQDKVTKPTQYNTVFSEVADGTRDKIHNNLTISDLEVRNKWTIIAKNNYDLTTIEDQGIEAVVYNSKSNLAVDDNLAFTVWFKHSLTPTRPTATLIDGKIGAKGLKLELSESAITAEINGLTYTFNFPANSRPTNTNWYGMVFNLNNSFNSMGCYVYKLNPNSNRHPNMPISETLKPIMQESIDLPTTIGWVSDKQWSLMPGKINLTNVRLFKKTIEREQHLNVLQQYVVRDNHLAHIIDNAVPSIQLRRYNQNR